MVWLRNKKLKAWCTMPFYVLKAAPYRTERREKNMGLIRFNGKFGAKGTGILNVQLKQLKIHLSLLSANAIKIMKL